MSVTQELRHGEFPFGRTYTFWLGMFAVARGSVTGDHLKKSYDWKNYVLEGFLISLEFFYVLIRINMTLLESFLKLFLPKPEKSLAGEIALVTGSGHGIGRELVLRLASEGCRVVGWDINEEGNAETKKLLKEKSLADKVHLYVCDVTRREDVLSLAKKVEEEVGPVSLLINNAGIMICKPMRAQTHTNIENVFKVNVLSHFWTIEAFLPKMKERNSGHIVAICSACGIVGLPNAVPYSASKFALKGFMETLCEELRVTENNTSIKFTTVNPIAVDTGLAKKPKNRFPSLINVLTVEEVCDAILKAIKHEAREISVPPTFAYFDQFMRLFPREVYEILKDFMGTGVDPE